MTRLSLNIIIVFVLISYAALSQSVVINEVQYSNQNTLYDSDGDTHDWIELLNTGNIAVNLNEYILSDEEPDSTSWTFPDYLLQPGQFLLIFASGKNRIDQAEFHTNFKLQLMSDPLYLINPQGIVIDYVDIRCIPPDKTFGRKPDGSLNRVILEPTPVSSNNNAEEFQVDFKPDSLWTNFQSGFYSDELELEIHNLYPQNSILYTIDGEIPEEDSQVYSSNILLEDISNHENRFANIPDPNIGQGNFIPKANILRARVFSEGCPASPVVSNTYFVGSNFEKNKQLPIISLITEQDNLFDEETGIYVEGDHNNFNQHGEEWERPVHVELFDKNQNIVLDQDAGVRIHGRFSRFFPQKSLRLYARNEYGKKYFEYPVFSQKPHITKFKRLLLRGVNSSPSLFRDDLCQYLVKDMDIDYTATETSIVFINGEYWGIYSLRERQDKWYVANNFNSEVEEIDIIGYDATDFLVEQGTSYDYRELLQYLQFSNPLDDDFYYNTNQLIDFGGVMDFFAAHFYFANHDFPHNNFEYWKLKNDTAKWRCFFFDLDQAMMSVNKNPFVEYNNTYPDFSTTPETPLLIFRALINNPQFRNEFHSRLIKHTISTFSIERVLHGIDYFDSIYHQMVPEQIYRWNYPLDIGQYKHDIESLETFAIERPLILTDQIINNFGKPFVIYPNPANGPTKLKFVIPVETAFVTIYNSKGNAIAKKILKDDQEFLITDKTKTGIYFIQVQLGQYIFNEKLIVY